MTGTMNEVLQPQEFQQSQQQSTSAIAEQKKGPAMLVRADSDGSLIAKKEQQNLRPTFWEQFPWRGIGPLIGIVLCSSCAVAVIGTSNGVAKPQWKLHAAPNVLVSVLSSIASILMTMAVAQGVAISWWRRAMRGTYSVEDLHHSWAFSSSTFSLVSGWKFWNGMALTALCTKFAIIDTTLFQKALSTRTALGMPTQIQSPAFPLETFPSTGTLNDAGNDTASMNWEMTWDTYYWTLSSASINAYYLNGFYNCAGLCGLTYRGIGFESVCTQTNVSAVRTQAEVNSGAPNANLQMNVAFEQRWPTPEKNYSYINMEWAYWTSTVFTSGVSDTHCGGQFVNLTCELRPSVIDYPISMRNSSYTRRESKTKDSEFYIFPGPLNDTAGTVQGLDLMSDYTIDRQVPNFTVVNNIDILEQQVPGGNTSIGGIAYALQQYYNSRSIVSYDNTTTVDPTTGKSQTSVQPILQTTGLLASLNQMQSTNDGCPTSYSYDYDSMLQSINTLMILVSSDVWLRDNYTGSQGDLDDYYNNYTSDVVQYLNTTQFMDETYYVSRMGFAWGAYASTLVVVILILPSYWKFWELGRKVTLGPIDIINALETPEYAHLNRSTASHVDGVALQNIGNEKAGNGACQVQEHGPAEEVARHPDNNV